MNAWPTPPCSQSQSARSGESSAAEALMPASTSTQSGYSPEVMVSAVGMTPSTESILYPSAHAHEHGLVIEAVAQDFAAGQGGAALGDGELVGAYEPAQGRQRARIPPAGL